MDADKTDTRELFASPVEWLQTNLWCPMSLGPWAEAGCGGWAAPAALQVAGQGVVLKEKGERVPLARSRCSYRAHVSHK